MGGQQYFPMSDPQSSLFSLHRFSNSIHMGVSKPPLPPELSGPVPPAREKVPLGLLPKSWSQSSMLLIDLIILPPGPET